MGRPLLLRPVGAPLWFEPHDVRFDFDGTAAGAAWIDELAGLARRRLEHSGPNVVIGHFDWRVENLAFQGADIVAIYDWDSVAAAPEAVVVGNAVAQFTADWTSGEFDPLPSVAEMRSFVSDYERARGARFDDDEREDARRGESVRLRLRRALRTFRHDEAPRDRPHRELRVVSVAPRAGRDSPDRTRSALVVIA